MWNHLKHIQVHGINSTYIWDSPSILTPLDFPKLVPNIKYNLVASPLMVDTDAVPDSDCIYEAGFCREFRGELVVEDTTDTYTTSCY